jgi:hypothetical protein
MDSTTFSPAELLLSRCRGHRSLNQRNWTPTNPWRAAGCLDEEKHNTPSWPAEASPDDASDGRVSVRGADQKDLGSAFRTHGITLTSCDAPTPRLAHEERCPTRCLDSRHRWGESWCCWDGSRARAWGESWCWQCGSRRGATDEAACRSVVGHPRETRCGHDGVGPILGPESCDSPPTTPKRPGRCSRRQLVR